MTLDDLKSSLDPIIKTAADKIARYRDELMHGRITADEYKILIRSALAVDNVAVIANDIARAALVSEAFDFLLSVALA